MTSSPDATPVAVSLHSHCACPALQSHHSPLTVARVQNCLDIVATRGLYLVNRVGTPVDENSPDDEFAAKLARKLNAVLTAQACRKAKYGKTADEWPIGHTPPDVKEKRMAKLRALEEHEGAVSDNDSDDHNDGSSIRGKVNWGKGPVAPDRPARPYQEYWLPTPPPSIDITVLKPHGKKRRNSGADEGEDIGSTRILSIDSTVPPRGKRMKRRVSNDDEDQKEKKRPTESHIATITTIRASRRLYAARLRAQLEG